MQRSQIRRHPEIQVRNVRFEGLEDLPLYWHQEGPAVSLFINALSAIFPEGERFFVRSVRAQLSSLTDAELLQTARAFCAQEALHGREHEALNQAFEKAGFPVHAIGNAVRHKMQRYENKLTPTARLAATAALEHLTAMLGHLILSNPELVAGPEAVVRLLRWHAAEELEHKAVAIDVFRRVGGREAERISIYLLMMSAFVLSLSTVQYRLMRKAGMHKDLREWARFGRFLFAPERLPTLLPMFLDYFRPGFHPWDHDDSALLEAWKAGDESIARASAVAAA